MERREGQEMGENSRHPRRGPSRRYQCRRVVWASCASSLGVLSSPHSVSCRIETCRSKEVCGGDKGETEGRGRDGGWSEGERGAVSGRTVDVKCRDRFKQRRLLLEEVRRSKVRSGVCGRGGQCRKDSLCLRRGACLSACFHKRFLLIRHQRRGNSLNRLESGVRLVFWHDLALSSSAYMHTLHSGSPLCNPRRRYGRLSKILMGVYYLRAFSAELTTAL